MADSLFMGHNQSANLMAGTFGGGDESFVKSKIGSSSRRPHHNNTMVLDKSAATLLLSNNVSSRAMK